MILDFVPYSKTTIKNHIPIRSSEVPLKGEEPWSNMLSVFSLSERRYY